MDNDRIKAYLKKHLIKKGNSSFSLNYDTPKAALIASVYYVDRLTMCEDRMYLRGEVAITFVKT